MIKRPLAAKNVGLTDDQLAKIGLAAVLETTAASYVRSALKSVEHLSVADYLKLESKPLSGLCERLQVASNQIDPDLKLLSERLAKKVKKAQVLRHQMVHALWAINQPTGEIRGIDMRRGDSINPDHFDWALEQLSEMTLVAHACATIVVQMIADGALEEGDRSEPGPYQKHEGHWWKF